MPLPHPSHATSQQKEADPKQRQKKEKKSQMQAFLEEGSSEVLEALIFDLSFFHVIARVLLCVCVRRVRACVHCHARAHVQERGRERERGCAQRWWLKRCDAGGGPKQGERKGAAEEGAPRVPGHARQVLISP